MTLNKFSRCLSALAFLVFSSRSPRRPPGVPSSLRASTRSLRRCSRRPAYRARRWRSCPRKARLRASIRLGQARSHGSGDAGHAIRHRLDQQTVHCQRAFCSCSRRESSSSTIRSRNTFPGSRAATKSRYDRSFAHIRLPGFLAAGLRATRHGEVDHAAGDTRPLGKAAARLRARHALAVHATRIGPLRL